MLQPSSEILLYGYPFIMALHTITLFTSCFTSTVCVLPISTPGNSLSIQYAGYSFPSFLYTAKCVCILSPFHINNPFVFLFAYIYAVSIGTAALLDIGINPIKITIILIIDINFFLIKIPP